VVVPPALHPSNFLWGGVPVHASAYGAGGNASGSASGSASSSRKNLPLNSGVDVNVGIGVSDAPPATTDKNRKSRPILGRFGADFENCRPILPSFRPS
jgi:hypothetical protein